MNPKRILVATALGVAIASTVVEATPGSMRTILRFTQGAWTSPVAVVLRTPDEWIRWNDAMVVAGRAVAAEPLPAGVDWSREVVLVVAIGERPTITSFTLDPPCKLGHTLYLTGRVEETWTQSFSSPCHVVAIDHRYADSIVLDPAVGTLEPPFGTAAARPLTTAVRAAVIAAPEGARAAATAAPQGARTWGMVKHVYR